MDGLNGITLLASRLLDANLPNKDSYASVVSALKVHVDEILLLPVDARLSALEDEGNIARITGAIRDDFTDREKKLTTRNSDRASQSQRRG